jgi:hypothetical protein
VSHDAVVHHRDRVDDDRSARSAVLAAANVARDA